MPLLTNQGVFFFFVKKVDGSAPLIVLKVRLGCVAILFDRKASVMAHVGKGSTLYSWCHYG